MPTTQEEKPVKPRTRSRKTDQRNSKAGAKAQAAVEQASVDAAPVGAMMMAAVEEAAAEQATVETAPVEAIAAEVAPAEAAMTKSVEAALTGEVLPPVRERDSAPQTANVSAIAQAYGDYTRKSWQANRFLMERLIAARSFDEVIEIQGEFARQAYANFLAQSERICVLYGEWAQQYLRPFDKFTADWGRAGR